MEIVLSWGNPRDAEGGGKQVPRKSGCLLQQEHRMVGMECKEGPET